MQAELVAVVPGADVLARGGVVAGGGGVAAEGGQLWEIETEAVA